MTNHQVSVVNELLASNPSILKAHHGDCIGADSDFHLICRGQGLYMIGHPPHNYNKRAFCQFDEERRPQDFLVRNKAIVDESEWMIFTPRGMEEELRSGTWSTIRYARKKLKTGHIVYPNGKLVTETY